MEEKQSDNFLVGIRCYTYNQSQYITDALNGFTMQQTTFPFIAMVVDDASTDGEQEVIAKYVEENFELSDCKVAYKKETDYAHITYAQHKTNKNCYIAVLYLKENLYSKKQGYKKLEYLAEWRDETKYEAICEGDDYWIDPLKLQKQVDFLENNPEYGMCYTRCYVRYGNKNTSSKVIGGDGVSFDDFMSHNSVPTLTVVYHKDLFYNYIQDVCPMKKDWLMGDYPFWIWLSYNSNIKFMDNKTSVYRVLALSVSHSVNVAHTVNFAMNTVDILEYFNNKFQYGKPLVYYNKLRHQLRLRSFAIHNAYNDFIKEWFMCVTSYPSCLFNINIYKYSLFFFIPYLRKKRI